MRARPGVPLAAMLASALGGCVATPAPAPAPPVAVSTSRLPVTPAPPPKPRRVDAGYFGLPATLSQGGIALGQVPAGTTALRLGEQDVTIAPDGRFLIAFDRDAPPSATLTATMRDGAIATATLPVAPRAWRIENLSTLPKTPVPSADFTARRPAELAQIAAARAMRTDADGWRQAFRWPATGRVSGLFGAQRIYRGEPGSYHGGVDVAKPTGAVVVAPADGVVTLAADHPFTLEGNLLMIDHGMGLNSAFLHLSRIDVRVGDHVRQGQPIGLVGATGRATGPHLHWGMKWENARIDPLLVAGPMPNG